MSLRTGWITVALLLVFAFCANAQAAEVKIGVFNSQKVFTESTYGRAANQRIQTRAKQLEAQFKPEQDSLVAMQQEIEKKSSAWSQAVKADKIRDFQKRQRDFQGKTSDARFEIQQMRDKEMEPFIKALQNAVTQIGKDGGYTMVMEMRSPFEYFSPTIDLTDTVIKQLNTTLK